MKALLMKTAPGRGNLEIRDIPEPQPRPAVVIGHELAGEIIRWLQEDPAAQRAV